VGRPIFNRLSIAIHIASHVFSLLCCAAFAKLDLMCQ